MADEFTKEEVEQRAGELARRVMTKPPEPRQWPGKAKPTPKPAADAKPRKRRQAASGS